MPLAASILAKVKKGVMSASIGSLVVRAGGRSIGMATTELQTSIFPKSLQILTRAAIRTLPERPMIYAVYNPTRVLQHNHITALSRESLFLSSVEIDRFLQISGHVWEC